MSNIINIVSEETYIDQMKQQNALLAAIASQSGGIKPKTWTDVKKVCSLGLADKLFTIGDRLTCTRSGATLTWDVVNVTANELTLLLHTTLYNVMFYPKQSLYYASSSLAAGTYNFICTGTSKAQFTLSSAVPAGGQVVLTWAASTDMSTATISTYSGATSTSAIESGVAVSAGTGGTALSTINDISRARFGSNRYDNSSIRQLLNSSAAAGSVWTSKTNYDRPPSWVSTEAGFLNGLDADFLAAVSTSTITVAAPTADGGGSYTVSDKFFLPSRYELYADKENSISEGVEWGYYSAMAPAATTSALAGRIKKDSTGTAVSWTLRTPVTTTTSNVEAIVSTGALASYLMAGAGYGIAPACKIGG